MTPPGPGRRYYSSEDKDLIRERFDLPLLEALQSATRSKLRYFGLPGSELLDVKTWRHLLSHVSAVERRRDDLETIEAVLETDCSDLRSCVHFGDVDLVILRNRGNRRDVGGQTHQPWVGTRYDPTLRRQVWDFDVVNLDYFGPFLPPETGSTGRKKDRANALRKLFDIERQDAWKQWVLLVTVEAALLDQEDKVRLRRYLSSISADAETSRVIDFLTAGTGHSVEDTVRLLHGVSAALFSYAASNANLDACPRGTVLYRGAADRPMIHLAYQFRPRQEPIGAPVSIVRLLRAPILRPKNPAAHPWFELLPAQAPGITSEAIEACLDFMNSTCRGAIAGTARGTN